MAKTATQFVCQNCGARHSRWSGKCDQCGEWNSLVETEVSVSRSGLRAQSVKAAIPEKLTAVSTSRRQRIDSGIGEVNQVLGGGIVPGSIMLLSGDPGVGKSTLTLQLAAKIAAAKSVLYVSGEESVAQIKLRADRLGISGGNLELLTETSAETVAATVEQADYSLVVIDSIQTMATEGLNGSPGTVGQITASAQVFQQVAKRRHVAFLIIGHVTKEGNIAGPKILEHLVDVVLYLEGEKYGAFKALRGIKNRFGSTDEVGIFEMQTAGLVPVPNPSEALLAERQVAPGSTILATLEGTRPLLVEVQALVSPSSFGYPKRTAAGFDLNRLNLLVAVLQRRANLNLSNHDIYVNIVGGLKIAEPAADVAIILSIASAFMDRPLPQDLVAYGEVGLSGEIRSVSHVNQRLAEAKKLGFKRAVGPSLQPTPANVRSVKNIKQAIEAALPAVSTKS
jgi:DNA repair protein RadA/Sms